MNRPTSVYLDLVRFTAALTVFLGHVSGLRLTGGVLWQLGPYMPQAVIIFFVLSGFVISYVTQRNENTAGIYVINRAARIYSVALPALLLTFVLDTVGRSISPGVYNESWGYVADGRIQQFAVSAVFAGRLWNLQIDPGSCLPYWSLNFEVWYYVLFGLAMFAPRRWAPWLVAAACLIAGPIILLMFPLWLIGVAAQRLSSARPPTPAVGAALCFGSLALWIIYEIVVRYTGRPYVTFVVMHGVIQDYLLATVFAVHIVGFSSFAPTCRINLAWLAPPIRWFAGATFTLYLFHAPIAQFLIAISPWPITSWANRALMIGGTFVLVLAVAQVTERRKDAWRRAITALVLAPRRRADGAAAP